ncbi:RNA polymerase sigma-70 factor [Pedobacter sp. MC2016-14]|uniref:RNA polymerase sigma-70 factor n=1 Tax=Pedobacter sp. MC2016-14 TaxID=2897327 RepID=UPI001E5CA978|nr:RNA polymerase sigma-70 factor [Pedobacter sp. MC2016-14]MCD0488603.1 RNA polymerase sigma-70 factor [Pedobacter sp. MC2016-14]
MYTPLDISAFEALFKENYKFLCLTSFRIVKDEDIAMDVVQDFFLQIWQRRNELSISVSFRSYATTAVRNLSLQLIKKDQKEQDQKKRFSTEEIDEIYIDDQDELLQREEIDLQVMKMVDLLPAERKKVFLAFVVDELSYAQIAEKYGISVNTVKTQMKRAYAALKSQLSNDAMGILICSVILSEFIKK